VDTASTELEAEPEQRLGLFSREHCFTSPLLIAKRRYSFATFGPAVSNRGHFTATRDHQTMTQVKKIPGNMRIGPPAAGQAPGASNAGKLEEQATQNGACGQQ
jgi:hypothetical protein